MTSNQTKKVTLFPMTAEPSQHGITVGAAADAAGITVRTLHHWDEIGLASPSGRSTARYRLYTQADLDRLARVIAYREAGVALEDIRALLDDPGSGVTDALQEQRTLLTERIHDLQRLDARLARMIHAHEHGIILTHEEQAETFGATWDPQDAVAARARWGGRAQWAQFAERSAARSKGDWRRLADQMRALQVDLVAAKNRGVGVDDPESYALVDRHRELFSNLFPLTLEMQVCLARMFEADPGFASYYNGLGPGLAAWFRQIVDATARFRGIDPDTATWQ